MVLGWTIAAILWRGLEHTCCARMVVRKWPTMQARRVGWPIPGYPREPMTLHIDAINDRIWGLESEDWKDSHPLAINAALHQLHIGMACLKQLVMISRVNRAWYHIACTWVATTGEIVADQTQPGAPDGVYLLDMPDPLPSCWPVRLEAYRGNVQCMRSRYFVLELADFAYLAAPDRLAMQLLMPLLPQHMLLPAMDWQTVHIPSIGNGNADMPKPQMNCGIGHRLNRTHARSNLCGEPTSGPRSLQTSCSGFLQKARGKSM